MEEKVELRKCCAICEYLYDKDECPLFQTYQMAEDCGTYNFSERAKYMVSCSKFKVNDKFYLQK